jgi:hypothetical protein
MSNSSRTTSTSVSSISTTGLLGVLFVGLKLTGHINWPWLWVLSPFWIPIAILLAILVVAGLFLLIAYLIDQAK